MSCTLRAVGRDFDVDSFLRESPFARAAAFHRGEPRGASAPAGDKRSASGFGLAVVEAGPEDDLEAEVSRATEFLRVHEEELRRLSQFPGLEEVCLEFGLPRREPGARVHVFPAELLWLAGALDIDLVVITGFPTGVA